MRTVAGLLAFHALLLAVGLSLLLAAGLVRLRLRDLLLGSAAAHLAGVAATTLVFIVVLILGGQATVPTFVAVAVVLSVAFLGIAALRTRRALSMGRPHDPGGADKAHTRNWLAIALGLVIGLFVVGQALTSRGLPTAWDAAHNWTVKAVALTDGDLSSAVFRDEALFLGSHASYPILHPVLGSLAFRFAADTQQSILVAELWLLVGALVAASAFLLRARPQSQVLALVPLGILVATPVTGGLLRGDADVTMAVFLAAGTLCLGLWLERQQGGLLWLGGLMLAAAANTKNEGVLFSLMVVTVAVAATLPRPRLNFRLAGLCALAVVAAIVPWKLWTAAHGPFASDITPFGTVLQGGFLVDRIHSLDLGAQAILVRLLELGGPLIPAFVALTVVGLRESRLRRVTGFYSVSILATLCGIAGVYWISTQPDLAAHIERTSLRTITAPLFLTAVALAHLLSRLDLPGLSGPQGGESQR